MRVVTAIDSSTDKVHRYIDNGTFWDGRAKTLKECGMTQQHPTTSTRHTNKTEKGDKENALEGNKSIAGFCRKEDYHYTKWMQH